MKISRQYNKELSFIKKDYKGNVFINNMFVNGDGLDKPPLRKLIKWVLSKNPQKEEKKNDPFKLKVITDTSFLANNDDVIVWLGHATFFIRLNNITFLTDPCFDKIPFKARNSKLPFPVSTVKNLNYVLVSHGHRDHLDKNAVKKILMYNPEVKFLCPLKMNKLLRKWGVKNIEEAGWYQHFNTKKEVEVFFLPARHWHKRGMFDYNSVLWGSFLVRSGKNSIYFGGDTGYGKHFKEIQEIIPETQIVIMPIGAYSPPEMMEESHINPEEAIQACNDLNGKLFIPMHYGTFDLSDEPLGEPIKKIIDLKTKGKLKGGLKILNVGENYGL